ncbi:DUF4442 domain-containing protein [Cardiobacteriaceae bacterium TAE3-ERU3]|nr:DUF4442 domain-containing protein [Cardiobacteriaceae bacterium TAE3-ERU3]
MKSWFIRHPNVFRCFFNLWPPFLFTGICVERIGADWMSARVRLRSSPLTKNINGSQYGGSLFSMTDPVYTTLLLAALGHDKYYVWDKAAEIDYQKPGRGTVFFEATLTPDFLEEIRQATQDGSKYLPTIKDRIFDRKGDTVAEVTRTLYIRLRPEYRPSHNISEASH